MKVPSCHSSEKSGIIKFQLQQLVIFHVYIDVNESINLSKVVEMWYFDMPLSKHSSRTMWNCWNCNRYIWTRQRKKESMVTEWAGNFVVVIVTDPKEICFCRGTSSFSYCPLVVSRWWKTSILDHKWLSGAKHGYSPVYWRPISKRKAVSIP